MKNYKIRNQEEKLVFDTVKSKYDRYLSKKEKIIELAIKSIKHLSDSIQNESALGWLLEEFVDIWIWKVTQAPGPKEKTKYIGQRYWTKGALNIYLENLKDPDKRKIVGLRHEHICTKKELINKIINLKADDEVIRKQLNKAVACIVTEKEHGLLNDEAKGWRRYIATNIEVVDLLNNKVLESKDLKDKTL